MKNITVLGSTGSIGTQTLEVVRETPGLRVVGLAAGRSADLLEEQIREFKPKMAVLWDEEKARKLRESVKDMDIKIGSGMEGLLELAVLEES